MASINVLLADEEASSLKKFVYSLITDEIKQARRDTSLDKTIVSQTGIAEYLGVSPTTIREYEKIGLPHGSIGKRKFYDKEECRRWILQQQID